MLHTKQKTLVEVCPQCCKLIDSSAYRLVYESCGHSKCRICLIQEITGCLLCNAEKKTSIIKEMNQSNLKDEKMSKNPELQKRKSVITSLAMQKVEQNESENVKSAFLSPQSVDKDTCHLIKQSLEKDILFPTEIVKKSTGNFYHLKRIFSQRFFNEDNNVKKHKACETEEMWGGKDMVSNYQQTEDGSYDKRNWKLPNHIQIQYYCTTHNVTIQEKSGLKLHMTCNCNDEKHKQFLYKCKICDKGYTVVGKLNRHMKMHTKTSRFKCEQCGKPCADNFALKIHERTHIQLKPYSCLECGQKFSSLQNFKRHEKKHKNEKKFICDDCGFQFITKTELKRHCITHTNVKSFVCQVCSCKFAFKRTLLRHAACHNANLIKIKCLYCESTFRRKDNLERHIKMAHFELKIKNIDN